MSNEELTLVRVSRKKIDRLKKVATRDGFSHIKALDILLGDVLKDAEAGKIRFGSNLERKGK